MRLGEKGFHIDQEKGGEGSDLTMAPTPQPAHPGAQKLFFPSQFSPLKKCPIFAGCQHASEQFGDCRLVTQQRNHSHPPLAPVTSRRWNNQKAPTPNTTRYASSTTKAWT